MTALRQVFGRRVFVSDAAQSAELPALRAYIVEQVGEVTPLDVMRDLSAHNPAWLHAVRREGVAGYAGAFALLPLRAEAAAAFGRNAMTGAQITLEHVTRGAESPQAIYLGSILSGSSRIERGATLGAYYQTLAAMTGGVDVPMYTRPVSEDGQRITLHMGYRPVMDAPHALGEMIYRR